MQKSDCPVRMRPSKVGAEYMSMALKPERVSMHDMEDRRGLRHAYTSPSRKSEHCSAGGLQTIRKYVSGRVTIAPCGSTKMQFSYFGPLEDGAENCTVTPLRPPRKGAGHVLDDLGGVKNSMHTPKHPVDMRAEPRLTYLAAGPIWNGL